MARWTGALAILGALVTTSGVGAWRPQSPVRDATPSTASTATGSIRGRVITAGGDAGVRRARIILTASSGDELDPIYCDNDGRFEAAGVPAGRYTVSAWKSGYVRALFGARTYWDAPSAIAIGATAPVANVDIALTKAAAIAGRVTNEFGEPLIGMTVAAGRIVAGVDRPQFRAVGAAARTDDLGEYRIGGLPPGTYAINVSGSWVNSARPASGGGPRWRSVFYPQATFLAQARPLSVRAGEDLGSIDVVYATETAVAVKVSGRVVDAAGQLASANVAALLSGDGLAAAATGTIRQGVPGGEFSFTVSPGAYTLIAQDGDQIALTHIVVESNDVAGIELRMSNGGRFGGRVAFDGATPPPANTLTIVAGSSAEPDASGRIADAVVDDFQRTQVAANGTFQLTGLIGRRQMGVAGVPRGWRVKSIAAAGRELLDAPLDFKGGEDVRNVVVTLTDRASEVAGTIVDAQQRPAHDISVLLFPEDAARVVRLARWVRPDQAGRFDVGDLPAGAYYVALLPDVDEARWLTREYLDPLRASATRVVVGDGEKQTVALVWSGAR